MVSASPFIHQSDRVQRRASDVSATDWQYQTHVENYPNFRRVLLGLFSGLGNPCSRGQRNKDSNFFYMDKFVNIHISKYETYK